MLYLIAVLSALALTVTAVPCVHKLQSQSYFVERGYFKIFSTEYFVCLTVLHLAVIGLELTFFANVVFAQIVIVFVSGIFLALTKRRPKLVFTKRVIRLCCAIFAVNFVICLYVPLCFLPATLPFVVLVAFFVVSPIELSICNHFKKLAGQKLQAYNFTKIAVVGSFAKTSVKQILQQLLPNCIASPNSCNTPMGICRFVNNTNFEGVDYAIFEMGARKQGDIKELCDLVNPHCAVFCGVAQQHLETFKTFENIVVTKQEVLHQLPQNGFAVLNGSNQVAYQSVGVGDCKKIVALADGNFEVQLKQVGKEGSLFELTVENSVYQVKTSLLGKSHADNIALCMCMACELGFSLQQLLPKIENLVQIEHRMEIIEGTVTVIDDGYNANIAGIENCAQTLSMLEGTKIAISQGIVEGGAKQVQLNLQVGKLLGQCCDVVVVCGTNSQQLFDGASQFCKKVEIADSLNSAVCLAQRYYDANTYVIFQNDIP